MNPAPETRRLFIGLAPPPELADRVASTVRQALERPLERAGLRLLDPQDMHVTLHYLGAFPDSGRATLESVLREELRGLSAPDLELTHTGSFPEGRAPRVHWVGVAEACAEDGTARTRLAALQGRCVQAALGSGWQGAGGTRASAPFRPHLTVARVRRGAPGADPAGPFGRLVVRGSWTPVEVALYDSGPPEAPGAARYRPLFSVPLVVQPG